MHTISHILQRAGFTSEPEKEERAAHLGQVQREIATIVFWDFHIQLCRLDLEESLWEDSHLVTRLCLPAMALGTSQGGEFLPVPWTWPYLSESTLMIPQQAYSQLQPPASNYYHPRSV